MGTVKRGAFAVLGGGVWKIGSKLGWRYAKRKLDDRGRQGERSADAAERTADASERTADAAERTARATEKSKSKSKG